MYYNIRVTEAAGLMYRDTFATPCWRVFLVSDLAQKVSRIGHFQSMQWWLFGNVWMHNRAMYTHSMIVGPLIILLQPHIGSQFLPQIRKKTRFSTNSQTSLAIKWG